jgi:hypothetical protein
VKTTAKPPPDYLAKVRAFLEQHGEDVGIRPDIWHQLEVGVLHAVACGSHDGRPCDCDIEIVWVRVIGGGA